jgi:hypothetical protein
MRNAWILLLAAVPLLAQDKPADRLRTEKKQTIDFPAGGLLRMKNSTGALTIEAWDKSTVELTTIKSAKYLLNTKDREKAAAELEKVSFTAERHGSELEVATNIPKHTRNIDISYHLWVPRDARLAIHHETGEINVEGTAADIEAQLRRGQIFLYLPEGVAYSTQAKCAFGGINAPGEPDLKPEHLHLGHILSQQAAGKANNLNLKVGNGDIYIMRQTPAVTGTSDVQPASYLNEFQAHACSGSLRSGPLCPGGHLSIR